MALKAAEVLKKQIASIGNRSAILKTDIQECAVQVIGHARMHGDITLCQRLLDGVSGAVRKDSLVKYMELYAPVKWVKKELVYLKRTDLEAWSDDVEVKLMALPWDEAKKEQISSVYDQLTHFLNLLKVMDSKAKKGEKMEHDFIRGILEEAKDQIDEELAKRKLSKAANAAQSDDDEVEELPEVLQQAA